MWHGCTYCDAERIKKVIEQQKTKVLDIIIQEAAITLANYNMY